MKRVQLVWWFPKWKGIRLHHHDDPAFGFSMRMFWVSIFFGWLEIRIWRKRRIW